MLLLYTVLLYNKYNYSVILRSVLSAQCCDRYCVPGPGYSVTVIYNTYYLPFPRLLRLLARTGCGDAEAAAAERLVTRACFAMDVLRFS